MNESKILTLTMNPTIDISTDVHQVQPERKLRCQPPRYEPGGGGINVCRAIHKLGGEATAMYLAGGYNGNRLKGLLSDEGIEHVAIEIEADTRQSLTVSEETSDRQYRFVMPGPEVKEEEWQKVLAAIRDLDEPPGYIVASGSLPQSVNDDFYARLARVARDIGTRLVLDTSGQPLIHAVREGVYLVKPNLRELNELFDEDIKEEADLDHVTTDLCGTDRCEVIVVSIGSGGAFLITEEERVHYRSPTVPIASKVGAGDSMVAGIVLSLARDKSVDDAVRFGVAAGAAAVMTPGSELCRREDTERLYNYIREETNE